MSKSIKELVLEVNDVMEKECNEIYWKKLCKSCKYSKRVDSKTICVIVKDLAKEYRRK